MPYFPPILTRASFVLSAGAAAGHAPADSTTYRFANQPGTNPSTADAAFAVTMPRAGRVIAAAGVFIVLGTLGSTEQFTVAVRNQAAATTENITTTLQGSAIANTFSSTALTLAFAQGDNFSIQFTTPAWATNPTATLWTVTMEVEYSS